MPPPDERDLGAVLRAEADRHEPDRAAMLRRIDRACFDQALVDQARFDQAGVDQARSGRAMTRRRLPAVRPMAAAAAVAGVLVLAVAGIELAGRSPARPAPVAAPPSVAAAATGDPSPSRAGTAGPPTPRRSSSSLGPPVATSAAHDGYLTAVPALDPHSIATWAQSNLTVTTTANITALDVTIKVARTAGVAKTGHWTSIPADMTVQTVDTSTGSLLYRFTLKDGATLAPGSYTFAAQYNHAAGSRPVGGDRWTATAGTVKLSGDFG